MGLQVWGLVGEVVYDAPQRQSAVSSAPRYPSAGGAVVTQVQVWQVAVMSA